MGCEHVRMLHVDFCLSIMHVFSVCICVAHLMQDDLIRELKQTLSSIKLEEKGVYVQASTLGSLEALLEFLRTSKVPVSSQCMPPNV